MTDEHFNADAIPAAHEEYARRLVLDSEDERLLHAVMPDGRQHVVDPPVGTVGGPLPGDDVTTTQARTIGSGGGPGDPRRMPEPENVTARRFTGGAGLGTDKSPASGERGSE